MSDKFDNLRAATRACIEQLGASRNEEVFEFRNAAAFTVVNQLLREYDRLRERLAASGGTCSLGELTQEEASLLQAFRAGDDKAKTMITIAAGVAVKGVEVRGVKERCEVVGIESARRPRS
jgi:hypothetical protein